LKGIEFTMMAELFKYNKSNPEASFTLGRKKENTPFTIMIVDECPVSRKLLTIQLLDAGYNVITASSGMQAIRLAMITKISIIIMETEMAEFDGFDTTIILRRKIASETQPIIIAYTNELSIKEKALKVGMNDVVCKTMDSNLLLQKIKDWLPKN
jgi:two-component system sensor histidine kinase/response regulator